MLYLDRLARFVARLRRRPSAWAVVISGTVLDDTPMTFGPFIGCVMTGAQFSDVRITVLADTPEEAIVKLGSLPAGLQIDRVDPCYDYSPGYGEA